MGEGLERPLSGTGARVFPDRGRAALARPSPWDDDAFLCALGCLISYNDLETAYEKERIIDLWASIIQQGAFTISRGALVHNVPG